MPPQAADKHVRLRWAHPTEPNYFRSPYISFTRDLQWGIFHVLLQEHMRKLRRPDRAPRKLYAIQAVGADIHDFNGKYETQAATAHSHAASEVLGHGRVRVVNMMEVDIPQWFVDECQPWFSSNAKFGYYDWLNKCMRDGSTAHTEVLIQNKNKIETWAQDA